MGLAILGSSSENQNETITQNASSGADNGGQSLTSSAGSTISVLDGGAISGAFSLIKDSFGAALKSNQTVSLEGIKGIKEVKKQANTTVFEDSLKWLVGGAALVAAALVFKK